MARNTMTSASTAPIPASTFRAWKRSLFMAPGYPYGVKSRPVASIHDGTAVEPPVVSSPVTVTMSA